MTLAGYMRKHVQVSAFPATKNKEAFRVLNSIFPVYEMGENILQANLENVNLMVHPALALLNVGWDDRKKAEGEGIDIYTSGPTVHTGILHEAGDKERIKVCEAYGVRALSMGEHYRRWYGSSGDNMYEVLKNTSVYQKRGFFSAGICSRWLSTDIPLLLVPFAQLADLAGISVPIHKGIIEIASALSKENFWETGLTLEKLGLDNLKVEEIIRYVTEGRKN